MRDVKLQSRTWESRSRVQQSRSPILVEEKLKKVRFNIHNELGSEPTLPPGVTLFLAKGETIEQPNTSTSTTMGPMDTPWPIPREDPQWSFIPTGGARPRVLTQPSAAWSRPRPEGPDPVSHPCRWIQAEMMKTAPPPLVEGNQGQ